MKKRRTLGVFSLLTAMTLFMTACGGSNPGYVLPTLAPRNTPTPAVEEQTGPTPTTAPDANNLRIIELNGEDYNQVSNFTVRGICNVSVKKIAHSGDFSFYVSDREDTSSCVFLNFTDTDGNLKNVSGKKVHVAAWVYQETGLPADFVCRLQGKRPDGITESPESITITRVPSGTWTLIEGDIPVYSNLVNPNISIEMSSSKDPFYFDDIRLTYDPYSSVPANTSYGSSNFDGVSANFENQSNPFASRGTAVAEVVSGGYKDNYALAVTGRTADWNGVQIDLSEHGLAGSKIWVKYAAKHDAKQKARIICSMQWTAVGSATEKYNNITTTESVLPNIWVEGSGSYTIPTNAETVIIYFESEGVTDFTLDDIVISSQDPALGGNQGGNQGGNTGDNQGGNTNVVIDASKYTMIHTLKAEKDVESQIFVPRGSATLEINKKGYSGSCFEVKGRTQNWNGLGIDFTNLDNKSFNVIGKEVYISFWVYHEAGSPMDFSATLQVNKPDGTSTWPERVSVEGIPSGKWTYVEGTVPVYANVKVPQINFELPGSDTADFMIDEVKIGYDPNSSVDPNPEYEEKVKVPFVPIKLDFEDNEAYFQSRGSSQPSLVYGGHESDMCMAVKGRLQNWHGVQADLSQFDLAGRTIEVTYWVYHEYTTPLQVNMTAEQNDGETTTYTPIVTGTEMQDGKWIKFNNTYTIPENVKALIVYFESPNETAEFYIDDVSITLQ
ncbi:MAG: carbohydrate binding domain-containing protein [Lachnospiraceae bacterium]|nr:carbohydrate binding domain-containing protein [Lachnospiraceae bacterium]